MYELSRISMHNWYLVDALDVPLSGHTAIIGQTGAGKSSILDAIQTVISGNNRNMLELNAAAGEQRSRSVKDYMLGCVSDYNEGQPRRERCESTLVLTFRDHQLGKCVAVGLLLRVDAEGSESTRRFIVEDFDFEIENMMERSAGNETVLSHADMISRIKGIAGEDAFSFYPNSSKFVAAYLEWMRPSVPPEPKHFMRSFSNALLTKEISDPTDFVRRFVLEPLPLDMKGVKSSIAIWREMASEVENMQLMISDLAVVEKNFQTGFHIFVQQSHLDVWHKRLEEADASIDVRQLAKEHVDLTEKKQAAFRELVSISNSVVDLRAKLDAMKELSRSSDSGKEIAIIDADLRALLERKNALAQSFQRDLQTLVDIRDLSHPRFPESLVQALDAAKSLRSITKDKSPEEWVSHLSEIEAYSNKIKEVYSEANAMRELRTEWSDRSSTMRRELNALSSLENSSATNHHSSSVRGFMSALSEVGISSEALPDLVDVEDASWAFALESLLGPNREAILVRDTDFSASLELLFKNRNSYDGVRLINAQRLRQMGTTPSENSIARIVTTDNPDIRAFIDFSVGRFERAEDEQELNQHRNAILRNGKTNSGVTARVFRDRPTILGKRAQQKAFEDAKRAHNDLHQEKAELDRDLALIDTAILRIQAAARLDVEDLTTSLNQLATTLSEIRGLSQKKTALMGGKPSTAPQELEELAELVQSEEAKKDDVTKMHRSIEIQIAVLEEKTSQAEIKAERLREAARQALTELSSGKVADISAYIDQNELVDLMDDEDLAALSEMGPGPAKSALKEYREKISGASRALLKNGDADLFIKRGSNGLFSFAQKWAIEGAPLAENISDEIRFKWVSNKLAKYRDNDLLQYREKLENARDEMETSLKEGLVSKLGEQFALLGQQVDSLNRRLDKHQFVGQTYQFKSSVSARFLPIYELVQVALDPEGDLDTPEARQGLAELEAILDSDDADIKNFGDYRNYFNFELFIEHPDPNNPSQIKSTPLSAVLGKLSGGQRQAPYYVAIGASMVSTYYPKAHPGDTEGMGLMLFDEAFNRLDIPNTQRLMALFRSLGLQVVVAVPEDKRATLIEAVDSVVTVSRMPGSPNVFIDSSMIGPKAKLAMLEENPEHQPAPA